MPAEEGPPAPSPRPGRSADTARSTPDPAPITDADPSTQVPPGALAGQEAPFTELHRRGQGRIRRFFSAHPVAMDFVVVLLYAVPTLMGAAYEGSFSILIVTTLASAVLFARRHRPLLTLSALTGLSVVNILMQGDPAGMQFALGVGIYTVATVHRVHTAWVAVTLSSAVVTTGLLLWGAPGVVTDEGDPIAFDQRIGIATGTLLFALIGMAIGITVRNRRESLQRLLDHGNQLALERGQQAQLAIAAERTRIAREMHDVVTHSVSVMVALADGAGASLDRKPDQAAAALQELSTTGRGALADMRRILGVLREGTVTSLAAPESPTRPDPAASPAGTGAHTAAPTAADTPALTDLQAPTAPQPDDAEVTALITRFQKAGLPVRHTHTGPRVPEDAALQLVVYRIVQESLTNVLRHCPGAPFIDVRVAVDDVGVQVIVENGPGSPSLTGQRRGGTRAGHGLVGMRERAAVFDGSVRAAPTSAQGWRVEAVLRFAQEDS